MKLKWLTRSKLWMSFLTCSAPRVMICSLAKCNTVPNPKVNPSSRVWHHLYFIQFLNGTCHSDEYNVCNCKKIWMRRSSIFVAGEGLLLKPELSAVVVVVIWVPHALKLHRCLWHTVSEWADAAWKCLPPQGLWGNAAASCLRFGGGVCYQKRRPPDESGDWVPLMWATSLWGLLWQLGDGVTERTNGVCVCAHGAGMAKGVLIEWAQGGFPKQWEDCVCMCVFARRKSSREFLCASCGSMVCKTPQHYKCFFYCNSSSAFSLNSFSLIATVLCLQSTVCVCVWVTED